MRRSTSLAVLVALVAAPAAAGHGGLVVTRICGASECEPIEAGLELVPHDGPPVERAEPAPGSERGYGLADLIAPLAIFGTVLMLWLLGRRPRRAPA